MTLSAEQRAIVEGPDGPASVIACAGSGKTRTAVHRVVELRRRMGDARGRVALLSFTNVAVETFRRDYGALAQDLPAGAARDRVDIDTLDGFITGNILRPHAHRTMAATKSPYLVVGDESFLSHFQYRIGNIPYAISKMHVRFLDGIFSFHHRHHNQVVEIPRPEAIRLIERLGRVGGYTHELGRYWCHRTLVEQPDILRALVRRYPRILIDESQDLGPCHQAILELLAGAGAEISLIGDPNQGIYEFLGADGRLLAQYGERPGVVTYGLTTNYRSVPSILALSNALSRRNDAAARDAPEALQGAYFVPYRDNDREQLIDAFTVAVEAAGLRLENSAVLCRATKLAEELSGGQAPIGQGLVKDFALAAVLRDKHADYRRAFDIVAGSLLSLVTDPPQDLLAQVRQPARYPEITPLRQIIWQFTRNAETGLPSAQLVANGDWHRLLLDRVRLLLMDLQNAFGLVPTATLGNRLARRELPDAPLITPVDLAAQQIGRVRIDTVHKAKGESLDAVLYLATREHIEALLGGVGSEVGRIGYVAATRARNLIWLGVPAGALPQLRQRLQDVGFREAIRG